MIKIVTRNCNNGARVSTTTGYQYYHCEKPHTSFHVAINADKEGNPIVDVYFCEDTIQDNEGRIYIGRSKHAIQQTMPYMPKKQDL